MSSLRIAMLSYHTCPLAGEEGKETGGMNVYVLELAKSLARQGHHVHIYTRSQDPANAERVEIAERLTLFHLPAGPQQILSKHEMLAALPEFITRVRDFITAEHFTYDLFHGHYYMSGLVGTALQQSIAVDVPLVMSFHTLALMKQLIARGEQERDGDERVEAERQLVRAATRIIAPSESDASYLQHLYDVPEKNIAVIPPGVNLERFHALDRNAAKQHIGADPRHNLILFVGRIEPLKGLDVLLYALKILASERPDLAPCLWIVGGDVSEPVASWSAELQRLEALRHTLGIQTSVKFVGQQHQDELPYYYNASEVVVMPSHYESFGMVAAEAMACGTPVITTNVSGISMLMDDHHQSLITSVNNPLLLAQQIADVLDFKGDKTLRGEQLRATVDDLDWASVSEQITTVYQQAIAEHQSQKRLE